MGTLFPCDDYMTREYRRETRPLSWDMRNLRWGGGGGRRALLAAQGGERCSKALVRGELQMSLVQVRVRVLNLIAFSVAFH